jgi:Flp pilus assembly protein CpaB
MDEPSTPVVDCAALAAGELRDERIQLAAGALSLQLRSMTTHKGRRRQER